MAAAGEVTTYPTGKVRLPAGADPALYFERPNIQELVFRAVQPLGGIVTWVYTAGEGDPPGWIFRASVQVDCRAHNRLAADRRADAVRRAVCALPWVWWREGVVNRVDVIEGPFSEPDGGRPRFIVRFRITFHPRAVIVPAVPAGSDFSGGN